MIFYCGSYTDKQHPRGILQGNLDSHTGEIEIKQTYQGGENPSYLILNPEHDLLYVLNEVGGPEQKGMVTTLRMGPKGSLEAIHSQDIAGWGSCYGLLVPSNRLIFTADYGSGSISQVELGNDFIPRRSTLLARFSGKGPRPDRQESSHVHSLMTYKRELYAADLGLDCLHMFTLATDGRPLKEPEVLSFPAGSGPRLMCSDGQERLYVVEELSSRISTWLRVDDQWVRMQNLKTLPSDWQGENLPAHIALNSRKSRLYLSNRGHNSLAVYDIDPDTGLLSLMDYCPLKTDFPRFFALSPCGKYLLAAGQNNHLLESFRLNEKGIPEPTGFTAEAHSVSSIHFLRI